MVTKGEAFSMKARAREGKGGNTDEDGEGYLPAS